MFDTEGNPSKYSTQHGKTLDYSRYQYQVDVYPVLTISTNSDAGKTLNKDSFIILNMNSNTNGVLNLTTEPDSISRQRLLDELKDSVNNSVNNSVNTPKSRIFGHLFIKELKYDKIIIKL